MRRSNHRNNSSYRLTLLFSIFAALLRCGACNDVYVVGYNDYGQLGLGDYLERATQTLLGDAIPLDVTKSVAAGLYHNVLVGENEAEKGIVYTWGRNTKGQLGIGSVRSQLSPVKVNWNTCKEPNSWVCSPNLCKERVCDRAKCRSFGPTNPYWSEADMHCMKPQDKTWTTGSHPEVVQVVAAEDSSYALTVEGYVFGWGSNDWGQLGISDLEEERLPRPDGKYLRDVPMLVRTLVGEHVLSVAAGAFHVLALTDRGKVWVWGHNSEGQLGLGDLSQRNQPALIQMEGRNMVAVACGAYHTLLLSDFGELFSAGLNANGQLGHGDEVSRKTAVLVQSLRDKNVSAIAAGDYASYAISARGEVYSWGNNAYRQLGHGNITTNFLSPARIEAFVDVNAVIYRLFGGQRTAFAVDEASDVYALGNNDFGMLGLGDETTRTTPAKLSAFLGENVYSVAAGAYHTIAITGCWEQAWACSGHGACDTFGRCQCDAGFRGYRCADECPGGQGNACTLHGDCIVPKGRAPYCICFQGYSGDDCSLECPGGASNVCSGQGVCVDSGECACDSGFSGFDCSIRCPGAMASPCSNLGACLDGSCNCFPGFAGTNCSTECNGGAYSPCSHNGVCQPDGTCECFPGFRYTDCACECPGGAENVCHGRGECLSSCSCACRMGYRGVNCSIDCPGGIKAFLNGEAVIIHACTGRGVCDGEGKCVCDKGWSGLVCQNGPYDWTLVILISIASLLLLCCLFCVYSWYRRRRKRMSERERKRNARKKLRLKGKKKKSGDKRDRSKKKGKINR